MTSLAQAEEQVSCLDFEVKTCRGSLGQVIQTIILNADDTTEPFYTILKESWNTAGELLGHTKKLPVQLETQHTVKLARSPASGTESVIAIGHAFVLSRSELLIPTMKRWFTCL